MFYLNVFHCNAKGVLVKAFLLRKHKFGVSEGLIAQNLAVWWTMFMAGLLLLGACHEVFKELGVVPNADWNVHLTENRFFKCKHCSVISISQHTLS